MNYAIWRYFYFFLWIMVDDAPFDLIERLNLQAVMQRVLAEGGTHFSTLADFNFLAGYTITLLPYEFGPWEVWEARGNAMLQQATIMAPTNPIYRLAYSGSLSQLQPYSLLYQQAAREAAPLIASIFRGSGMLNRYFGQVLDRVKWIP